MATISARHLVESPTRTARSRPFVVLTLAFALAACASYAIIVNLVPLMTERGISAQVAAVALGLGGAGQVLGRLGYRALVRRVGVGSRTVLIFAGVALTTALGPWIGAALASLLHGYAPMFLVLGGVAVLAALLGLATTPSGEGGR